MNKQIEKILSKNGITSSNSVIVYNTIFSSIAYFLVFAPIFLYFLCQGYFTFINPIFKLKAVYVLLSAFTIFVIAVILCYLFWASKSFGFGISESEIYAINPNYPFRSFESIKNNEIESIEIIVNKTYGFSSLFLSVYNYVLRVKTSNKTHCFHCYSLHDDSYDNLNNWRLKTIDGLVFQLKKCGYDIKEKIFY